DDQEVREDERPTAGPGPPEPAADVRDPDADLDGQWPGQRLTDGDALAHLLLRQPFLLAHQLAIHLANEGHGASESQDAEPQEIPNEVANGNALRRLLGFHRSSSREWFGAV